MLCSAMLWLGKCMVPKGFENLCILHIYRKKEDKTRLEGLHAHWSKSIWMVDYFYSLLVFRNLGFNYLTELPPGIFNSLSGLQTLWVLDGAEAPVWQWFLLPVGCPESIVTQSSQLFGNWGLPSAFVLQEFRHQRSDGVSAWHLRFSKRTANSVSASSYNGMCLEMFPVTVRVLWEYTKST